MKEYAYSQASRRNGSPATYTQNVIIKAYKQGLINRKLGEEPGPGQFAPVTNTIIDDGRQPLQEQLL